MSETNSEPLPCGERRAYARIQDAVSLRLLKLHDVPAAGEQRIAEIAREHVRRTNKYDISGYGEVKRDYPEVADYVSQLEERIRQLLLGGTKSSESPTHKVSLSASGMAFADSSVFYPDEFLNMRIVLFPSMRRINCDAKVISAGNASEIANGEKHTYRVSFVRISEEDVVAIEEHVHSVLNTLPISVD